MITNNAVRLRQLMMVMALATGIAVATTVTPAALATSPTAPSSARQAPKPPKPPKNAQHPTKSQVEQGKIARRVLDARPGKRGRILDFRKAVRAAGPGHKTIAQDVSLGLYKVGGKLTHLSAKERRKLAARAEKLGQQRLAWDLLPGHGLLRVSCVGANTLDGYWWGYRYRLDSCRTEVIKDSLETVAFVVGTLTVLFGSKLDARSKAITTAAIVIVAIGLFAVTKCSKPGRGVRFYHATTFGVADIWCLSQ